MITQADIDATERGETIWGTTRCLPEVWDIPPHFLIDIYNGTSYGRMIIAWYTGDPIPDVQVTFNPGFKADGQGLKQFIMAHLKTMIPNHDHKIGGCAYLLSQVITIKE
jgi:hypothetical protein